MDEDADNPLLATDYVWEIYNYLMTIEVSVMLVLNAVQLFPGLTFFLSVYALLYYIFFFTNPLSAHF